MKKDDLIAENAQLRQQIATLREQDKTLRNDFSLVLGSPTEGTSYNRTHVIYTWHQIFSEIGELLYAKRMKDVDEQVDLAEMRINTIERILRDRFPDCTIPPSNAY